MPSNIDLMGDNYKYNVTYHRFADLLGVDKYGRDSYEIANKIALLYDWGTKQVVDENDFVGIAKSVNDLQKKLGLTFIGKTLVNALYQWVRLDKDSERLQERAIKEKESEAILQWEKNKLAIKESGNNWKKEQLKTKKGIAREELKSQDRVKEAVNEFRKGIPKERSTKIKYIPLQESQEIPVDLGGNNG